MILNIPQKGGERKEIVSETICLKMYSTFCHIAI